MNFQRRLALGMVSLTALYSAAGHALGLGELQLQSALNQPLRATIQLQDGAGLSPADIRVSLADAETFSRVGLERPFFLTDLRFTPMLVDDQLVIRVESSQPVKEPYLNFLVQLTRARGALLREYTLLLDPPLYTPTPVVTSSAAPEPASRQPAAETPVRSAPAPAVARPQPQPVAASRPALTPPPGAPRYQTVAGDSLWAIAAATRVAESVPVQRQMEAILALNPQAFVNGDASRLRVGQELILPAAEQVGAPGAAFNQPSAVTRPAEPAQAQPAGRLRIEDPQIQAQSAETEELQNRLDMIESRFRGLLSELELRDAQIADLQEELETLRQARQQAQDVQTAEPVTDPLSAVLQPSEPGAIETATDWQQPEQTQPGWLMRWWPALLALLAALMGVLLLRSRRGSEPQQPSVTPAPVPQPITVPGSRTVDPLEGVELYLTYGRYPEARLMLEKAIAAEPQRLDLRLRLLGVLAELGEMSSFIEQEQQARALGADQLQLDLLKARYPQLLQAGRHDMVEQFEAPKAVLEDEDSHLNLGGFEMDQNWDLLNETAGLSGRRKEAAHHLEEQFESNLQDFPEVGELDEDELQAFDARDQRRRENR